MKYIFKSKGSGSIAVCCKGMETAFFRDDIFVTNKPNVAKLLNEHPKYGIDFVRDEAAMKEANKEEKAAKTK